MNDSRPAWPAQNPCPIALCTCTRKEDQYTILTTFLVLIANVVESSEGLRTHVSWEKAKGPLLLFT